MIRNFEELSAEEKAVIADVETKLDDATKKKLFKGIQLGVFSDKENLKKNIFKVRKIAAKLGDKNTKIVTSMMDYFKQDFPKIVQAAEENYKTKRDALMKERLVSDVNCFKETGTVRRYVLNTQYQKGIKDIIKKHPQAINAIKAHMKTYSSREELEADVKAAVEEYERTQKKIESSYPGSIEAKYGTPVNLRGLPHMKAFYLVIGFLIGYNWITIKTAISMVVDFCIWIAGFTHWGLLGSGLLSLGVVVGLVMLVKFLQYMYHNYRHVIEILGRNVGFIICVGIAVGVLIAFEKWTGVFSFIYTGIFMWFFNIIAAIGTGVAVGALFIFIVYIAYKKFVSKDPFYNKAHTFDISLVDDNPILKIAI